MTVTPMQVEKRLLDLSKEIDDAHQWLNDAETGYHAAKLAAEVGQAKILLEVGKQMADHGSKMNVAEKQAWCLVKAETLLDALSRAEVEVKAARANVQRLRVQVDIARSIGTSVRSSMEV